MLARTLDKTPAYRFTTFDENHVAHAVFTRLGGVSAAPYDSLNIGATVGDEPANVQRNMDLLYQAMQVGCGQVASPRQVHGKRVVRVGREAGGVVIPDCDGLVTDESGLYLLMRFADCAAVLLHDPTRKAIGLAHAGWQGTLLRVTEVLVARMQAEFGSQPAEMVAAVGPSIGPCCLEIGPEVVAKVNTMLPDAAQVVSRFAPDGHAYLDIWQANRNQLERSGVGQIEMPGICTRCSQQIFYSHRGSRGITGRFGVVIGLR